MKSWKKEKALSIGKTEVFCYGFVTEYSLKVKFDIFVFALSKKEKTHRFITISTQWGQ